MKTVLTKETLINSVLRPIGTVIDEIAEPGEIESLLFVNRARIIPDDGKEPPEDEQVEEDEDAELDIVDPDDVIDQIGDDTEEDFDDSDEDEDPEEPLPVDEQDIIDNEASQSAEIDLDELAEAIEKAGLPSNIFDALVDAEINSLSKLSGKLKEPDYKFSSIQGIGPKTEAKIREAFPV